MTMGNFNLTTIVEDLQIEEVEVDHIIEVHQEEKEVDLAEDKDRDSKELKRLPNLLVKDEKNS